MSSSSEDEDKSSGSDNDSSNEDKSGSDSDNESKSDKSGSDSDSDGSGSGSDDDNSGSGSGSDDDSDSDSDSDDSGRKKKKGKGKKGQDAAPKMSPYFSILSTLKSINFDMDDVTRKVDFIELKFGKKTKNTRFEEEEKKQLMSDVDEALNKSKKRNSSIGSASEASKKPRNYHAP